MFYVQRYFPLYQYLWLRFWSTVLLFIGGVCLSTLGFRLIGHLEQQQLSLIFAHTAQDHFNDIHNTFNNYLEPLEAISAFYGATATFDRQAFHIFATQLLASRPGISSLEWIPRVSQSERLQYEESARKERWPNADLTHFQFTERRQQGVMVRAGERSVYYPVYYQEPIVEGGVALGFDLGSNPVRLAALEQARDTGQTVASARVILVEETVTDRYSVLVFHPVYRPGADVTTVDARRQHLAGFVLVVLRISPIIETAYKQLLSYTNSAINFTLHDRMAPQDEQLLYALSEPVQTPSAGLSDLVFLSPATMQHKITFELGTRHWEMTAQPTVEFLKLYHTEYRWLVLALGLVVTIVVTAYFHSINDKNQQITKLVQERTRELQLQKTILECVSEASLDGILVVSANRDWSFFNERFVDLWKLPQEIATNKDRMAGMRWIVDQVVDPQESRRNIEHLYANPTARQQKEILLKSGAIFERYSAPIIEQNGGINGRVWYFRDITTRKQTEQALRASEARNRVLLKAMPDLIFRINKAGVFLDYHGAPGLTPMLPPEQFLGRKAAEVLPPNLAAQLMAGVELTLATGEIHLVEYQLPMLNGDLRYWERRTVFSSEEEVLVIVRDITGRKQAEEDLRKSQEQLQEQQRHEKEYIEAELARLRQQLVDRTRLATLGQVAATIAHELRNPLGAARNAAYYLRRYILNQQPETLEFLQIIDMEVGTADRIITDLLEMTRAKQPNQQRLDLKQISDEAFAQIKQHNHIQLHYRLTPEPFVIHADAGQMRQVLSNLMHNAVQAMPQGGAIYLSGYRDANWDIVIVQDNGPGIPKELHERIFEPLFSTKAKGTGLGLTICRQIVEKHGGSLQLIASEQGAAFQILLPQIT